MSAREAGFSVIEMTVVAAVSMITVGLATPTITTAIQNYQFNSDAQMVAATIRSARYKAVASNVALRLRFNCPAAGQMRIVEVTGDTAVDSAANRCDTSAYPYPDPDANAGPNNDGPVIRIGPSTTLPIDFDGIEISSAGRVVPLDSCPACAASSPPGTLILGDKRSETFRKITVTATGGTTLSRFPSTDE